MTLREQLIEAASPTVFSHREDGPILRLRSAEEVVDAVISVLREQGPQAITEALAARSVNATVEKRRQLTGAFTMRDGTVGSTYTQVERVWTSLQELSAVAIDALFPPSDKAE